MIKDFEKTNISIFKFGTTLYFVVFLVIFGYLSYDNFKNSFFSLMSKKAFEENRIDDSLNYLNSIDKKRMQEKDRQIFEYNFWNIFYKKNDFTNAELSYSWITNNNIELKNFHNLGNTFYKKWEKLNPEEKIKEWQKSLNSYEIAISSENSDNKDETIKNYEFVKNKLEKLKEELKKKKEEEEKNKKKEEWKEWQNWENQSWNGSQDKEQWEKDKIDSKKWTNSWQFNWIWQNNWAPWWEKEWLTPEEKQEINNYSDFLKQFQKENLQFLQNWKGNSSSFDEFFNDMRNDPFFKDKIDWEQEKDW